MPWVVLHELAHGFHDQTIGFNDTRVTAAWKKFCDSGKYKSVLTSLGDMREHYGLTDQKEFFAEMTECYFGSNGFYPFVAGESKQAEREIFALLADIWGPLPAVCSIKVKRQTMKCILTRIQLKGDCRRAERCGIACQPRVMARRTERSSAKNVHISKLNFLREKRRFDLPQTPTRATSDGRAADWRIVCSTGIAKRFGFASRERDHSEATIAKE